MIDALNEYKHKKDIKLIFQLFIKRKDLNAVNVEIFMTNKSEIFIQLNFQNMLKILHQDLILHDVSYSVIEHNISVFLRHKLHQIEKKHNL